MIRTWREIAGITMEKAENLVIQVLYIGDNMILYNYKSYTR
jgi:hypothetical protein